MDARRLPGASSILKRRIEGSGEEESDSSSIQMADIRKRSKRIRLETIVCSVKKDLSDHGSTSSSESDTEDSTSVEGVDYSIADKLLKCANDVDALRLLSNLDARAPLCTAVKNKHFPLTELLISFKANVDAFDEDGETPLHYAVENGDVEMTKLLLNNGAKAENYTGYLHSAASKKSIEIVEALLQQGVDVNVKCEVGNTVLYSAVSTACEAILESKSETQTDTTNAVSIFIEFVDMFYLLLRFNVDVNLANDEGSTPLHSSARNGNLEISALLLNKGANINAQDQYWNTPLHLAVKGNHADVVKLLIERGARVNLEDNMGFSPLHFAIDKNNRAIINGLLASGACANAMTRDGETPLHLAIELGYKKLVKKLLKWGAKANHCGPKGETPLHFASIRGNSKIIKALLMNGACVNSRCTAGITALHVAAVNNNPSAVATLLDNGADISMKGNDSYSAFDYARGTDGSYIRHVGAHSPDRQRDTLDSLYRHQAKLEAAGLHHTASGLQDGQREGDLVDFHLDCQLEIATMKSSFIANTNVSYFDIVKKGKRCVAKCLKNKSIVRALESEDYKRGFRIYAGFIGFRLREGLARKQLVERATYVFHRISDWPKDCTAKVLDFLDDDNLKVFLEV